MKLKNNFYIASLIILLISCSFIVYNVITKVEKKDMTLNSEGNLIVHYIDVGQGDSTFIELPNKETMLIDAGEKSESKKVINYINELGYETINYVVGTHPHSDHIGGLEEVIKTFNIDSIYMPKVVTNSNIYKNLLTTIKNEDKTIKKAFKDVNIIKDEELNISFLSPTKDEYSNINNYSAVLKITFGDNNFLFMGDAEIEVEKELEPLVHYDVLKVGHHGSDTSSSLDFIKSINPKYAIISVGKDNKYGHPDKNIIKKYEDNNIEIYRTDTNGTIKVIADGSSINIYKEKNEETISSTSKESISLISFTDVVKQGDLASIEIKGVPNTIYSIDVYYKSGKSKAKGLEDKVSLENGFVKFEWIIASQVSEGVYDVVISDGQNEERYLLTVEKR